jgi:hypothetical protein
LAANGNSSVVYVSVKTKQRQENAKKKLPTEVESIKEPEN